MRITVVVAGKAFELEVEAADGMEVLKNQVFSLADVELQDLLLVLQGRGVLKDDEDLTAALADGDRVYVKKEEKQLPGEWQDTCSRLYVEDEVLQPAYRSGDLLVCGGCITLCRDGEENEMDIHCGPFRCQCLTSNPGCLFACRSEEWYAPPLQAQVKEKLLENTKSAWKKYYEPGIQNFTLTLRRMRHLCMRFEEPEVAQSALSYMPKPLSASKATTVDFLSQLQHWFSREFFHWQNPPPCISCGNITRLSSSTDPSEDELRGLAKTVEIYTCGFGHQNRVARFCDPERLLDTRTGRHEEWAIAFAAFARACGFDVRLLWDGAERMWNEVWVERWVHCDAREGKIDEPLCYEAKGTKTAYAIACWKDGLADVSQRYSSSPHELKSLRNRVPEPWLSSHISEVRIKARKSLSEEEQKAVDIRHDEEVKALELKVAVPGVQSEQQVEPMAVEEKKEAVEEKKEPMAVEEKKEAVPAEEAKAATTAPSSAMEVSSPSQNSPKKSESEVSDSPPARSTTKEELKQAVEAAFAQLTKGCGNPACTNPHCASNPSGPRPSANEAAFKALSLVKGKLFRPCARLP